MQYDEPRKKSLERYGSPRQEASLLWSPEKQAIADWRMNF